MNQIRKNPLVILLLIAALGYVSYQVYMWSTYYFSQQEANKEAFQLWYEEEFLPSQYEGTLSYVDWKGDNYVTLTIRSGIGRLTYGLCVSKDQAFAKFISEGDKVTKEANSEQVTFTRDTGEKQTFTLPFCEGS